jgi:hypothetical protein
MSVFAVKAVEVKGLYHIMCHTSGDLDDNWFSTKSEKTGLVYAIASHISSEGAPSFDRSPASA